MTTVTHPIYSKRFRPSWREFITYLRQMGQVAAVGAVIVGGATAGALITKEHGPIATTTAPTGSGLANLWTDSNGGSCLRQGTAQAYNDATACTSIQAAYNASQCGDTIGYRQGTYTDQELDANGSSCSTQTTIIADGVVNIYDANHTDPGNGGALLLGGICKCATHRPPNHVTWDGGASKFFHTGIPGTKASGGQFGQIKVYADNATPVYPTNIILKNMIICNACPDPGNGTIEISSGQNFTVTNNQLGPVCCGLDWNGTPVNSMTEVLIGNNNARQVSTNVTISDNVFLGETNDQINWSPYIYWPVAALGTPPQGSCLVEQDCHADGVHAVGGNNIFILRNKWYNTQTQTLFFEPIQGIMQNVQIIGNYLDNISANCNVCINPGSGGSWVFAFNTVSANAAMQFEGTGFAGGTTATYVGNYGAQPSCSVSGVTMTFQYNAWLGGTCGGTDINVSGFNVAHAADWSAPTPDNGVDYALTAGANAISRVPTATCNTYVTVDLYGNPRPNPSHPTLCNAGADETR